MTAPIGSHGSSMRRAILSVSILMTLAAPLAAQSVVVRSVVGQKSIFIGQSFFFQVQVIGGTNVGEPDLTALASLEPRLIPLDRLRTQLLPQLKPFNLTDGTTYLYRLTPDRMGTVAIPSMPIVVDGKAYMTPPGRVQVMEPPPSSDYKLTLSLSKTRAYVGESLKLTAVWYYVKEVPFYYFNVPIFGSDAFTIPEIASANANSSGFGYYRGPMNRNSFPPGMAGRPGTAVINDIVYQTVTWELAVVADKAGQYDFPPSTVQLFTSGDGGGYSYGYRGYFRGLISSPDTVVGSRPLSVTVLPVPVTGRPANYSGIVSENLVLKTSIAPETMSVGDPVRISLTLSGTAPLESATLPPLDSLGDLTGSFSVMSDPIKVTRGPTDKTFSQTVRLRNANAKEVPPLAIPYFNTRTGSYELARSAAVPISVRPTKLVTADDLVGQPARGTAGAAQAAVRTWEAGIFYNYARPSDLLTSQTAGIRSYLRGPLVPVFVAAPLCVLAAALLIAGRRRAVERRPARRRAPSPLAALAERAVGPRAAAGSASGADAAALEQLRESLGARLALAPGRLTWADMAPALRGKGVDEGLITELGALFGGRELESYGGAVGRTGQELREVDREASGTAAGVRERIARAASRLEKLLP